MAEYCKLSSFRQPKATPTYFDARPRETYRTSQLQSLHGLRAAFRHGPAAVDWKAVHTVPALRFAARLLFCWHALVPPKVGGPFCGRLSRPLHGHFRLTLRHEAAREIKTWNCRLNASTATPVHNSDVNGAMNCHVERST